MGARTEPVHAHTLHVECKGAVDGGDLPVFSQSESTMLIQSYNIPSCVNPSELFRVSVNIG